MDKTKINNKDGITLIALVVTIIILIILAGVSISFLNGDNGILTQAQKSAVNYKNASEIEQIQIAYGAVLLENNMETVTPEQLQQELVNNVHLDVTVEKKKCIMIIVIVYIIQKKMLMKSVIIKMQ